MVEAHGQDSSGVSGIHGRRKVLLWEIKETDYKESFWKRRKVRNGRLVVEDSSVFLRRGRDRRRRGRESVKLNFMRGERGRTPTFQYKYILKVGSWSLLPGCLVGAGAAADSVLEELSGRVKAPTESCSLYFSHLSRDNVRGASQCGGGRRHLCRLVSSRLVSPTHPSIPPSPLPSMMRLSRTKGVRFRSIIEGLCWGMIFTRFHLLIDLIRGWLISKWTLVKLAFLWLPKKCDLFRGSVEWTCVCIYYIPGSETDDGSSGATSSDKCINMTSYSAW